MQTEDNHVRISNNSKYMPVIIEKAGNLPGYGKVVSVAHYGLQSGDLDVELDVYWLAQGGVDPVEYIKRYAKRLPLLHLKDRDPATNTFTELGTGDIPLAKCVEALEGSKCEWLIYEQDICTRPSIESARISYNNLKKILGY